MSRMDECIDTAARLGEIDPDRAEAAKSEYNKLRDDYLAMGLPEELASSRAAADLKEATKVGQKARYHKVIHQLRTMRKIKQMVDSSPNPANAIKGFLRYAEGHGFEGQGVEKQIEAWISLVDAKMQDVTRAVGHNMIGNSRDAGLLRDMIREAHGQETGNAIAKGFAKILADTEAMLSRAFNVRGGNIKILENRGIPQSHDADELIKHGLDAWMDFIETKLDWSRIENFQTGKPFVTDKGTIPNRIQTRRFLGEVYDGIITRGWDDRDPMMTTGGQALYNQRAEHRVLHFMDADAQLEYNKTFGMADPFSAFMNSLHGMARDIAHMDVLGPNPKMGLEFAIQTAEKRSADLLVAAKTDKEIAAAAKIKTQVGKRGAEARAILRETSGASSATAYVGTSRFFKGLRAFQVSTNLGSAVVSSVTDYASMGLAAEMAGMSATSVIAKSVELTASSTTRALAARMGYTAETLADTSSGMSRYFGRTLGGAGLLDRLAGFTLRSSGLNFLTDMRKIAFQMDFSGLLAENADRALADVDAPLRNIFLARGIRDAEWNALRHPSGRFWSGEGQGDGADFISPLYWSGTQKVLGEAEGNALAMKMMGIIREQLEFAVPTSSAEARAFIRQGVDGGTPLGIFANSAMSYKGFTGSMMLNQYRRFATMSTYGKLGYSFAFFVPGILMGALAVQMKELAKGNDPRPMNEAKFWLAAIMQFGGLGIFGDFFASETNRIGGGFAQTLGGPTVGLISDVLQPVASNMSRAMNGQETLIGRDVAKIARHNTPVLSSHVAYKLAYSRLVVDHLEEFLDPQALQIRRRQLKRQQQEYGTGQWFPRSGSGSSLRAPDLSNMLGDSR